MLKTRLAPFVISSALVLGSLGAAAKSTETQHAVDEQNFEFEETIDRELELFRGAQVSLQQALSIAERLHTGSRVVDISFDGGSNPPVYRVKNIKKSKFGRILSMQGQGAAVQAANTRCMLRILKHRIGVTYWR
jgi:hypothetical protein